MTAAKKNAGCVIRLTKASKPLHHNDNDYCTTCQLYLEHDYTPLRLEFLHDVEKVVVDLRLVTKLVFDLIQVRKGVLHFEPLKLLGARSVRAGTHLLWKVKKDRQRRGSQRVPNIRVTYHGLLHCNLILLLSLLSCCCRSSGLLGCRGWRRAGRGRSSSQAVPCLLVGQRLVKNVLLLCSHLK